MQRDGTSDDERAKWGGREEEGGQGYVTADDERKERRGETGRWDRVMTRERRETGRWRTRDDEREERDRKMGPVMTRERRERRETGRWDP